MYARFHGGVLKVATIEARYARCSCKVGKYDPECPVGALAGLHAVGAKEYVPEKPKNLGASDAFSTKKIGRV